MWDSLYLYIVMSKRNESSSCFQLYTYIEACLAYHILRPSIINMVLVWPWSHFLHHGISSECLQPFVKDMNTAELRTIKMKGMGRVGVLGALPTHKRSCLGSCDFTPPILYKVQCKGQGEGLGHKLG